MNRSRSPMDKAAEGLLLAGNALTSMHNIAAQVLPVMIDRADIAIDLVERGVVALEKIASSQDKTSS